MNKIYANASFLIFISLLTFSAAAFAENPSIENRGKEIQRKKEQILIKARQRLAAQEAQEKPVEKVEEIKTGIPEIPPTLKDRELGPAEQVRADDLEQKHAAGKISETEHKLEKDSLVRGANIKF